jgi:hypothetical protein
MKYVDLFIIIYGINLKEHVDQIWITGKMSHL